MKKILLVLIQAIAVSCLAYTQTTDEWLRQKETQKKYLLQQIVALKTYSKYAKAGYEIIDKGISTIGSIKEGDFRLHQTFFSSLEQVNPAIKNYSKVAAIIACQIRIVKETTQTIKSVTASTQFTPDEAKYFKEVFYFLIAECEKTIDELIHVVTSGDLRMKDDERIRCIERVYKDILSKYSFTLSLSNDIMLQSVQRKAEKIEIQQSKVLNSIK